MNDSDSDNYEYGTLILFQMDTKHPIPSKKTH